jgi:hypothetical protein
VTGLDTSTLRRALQPAPDGAGSLNLALIMRRGRRLRNRRRLGVVAGSLCAAALLAGTVTAITNLTGSTPVQPSGPAQPGTVQPGTVQPGPRHPDSSSPPQHQASGVWPTPTPRPTSVPSLTTRPPDATPSPAISPAATRP